MRERNFSRRRIQHGQTLVIALLVLFVLLILGAAFAAILLVLQDLQADDSVLKEFFNKFKKEFPQMAALAADFANVMVEGAEMIGEGWKKTA